MYLTRNRWCLISILLISACCASQRVLKTSLNPGCEDLCDAENVTTFHLRANSESTSLHFIWDFFGNPSLLLALTTPSAQLKIDWDNYLLNRPKSIAFTEEPLYTFGVVIQKLFEFNDTNDTGLLDTINKSSINILNTKMFNWIRKGVFNDTSFVELRMNGNKYYDTVTGTTRRGNIEIMVNGFCTFEHSDMMPHMLHTENSSQIDIVLNNLETNSTFANSRFGMELLLVSQSKAYPGMFVDTKKSLDDEHTPGVFEVIELKTSSVNFLDAGTKNSAYLQWRPVSFTGSTREVKETTDAVYYPLVNVSDPTYVAKDSLLHAYYGEKMSHLLVERINISFGTKGDGFYKKTNYSTWTVLVGYGIPPTEKFSYLVLMIMSIGIGLPALILIAIGIYFYARRKRQDNDFIN